MSGASEPPASFAARLLHWQRQHGRHGLPWQGTRDPYRVWLSEIMLQQTQVATVLGYFARFIQRFADVAALAAASSDEVMALWSGLGYYSRARNLHQCARQVMERFGGQFPRSAALLQTLPGIGPSTAAAIAAFCFDERAAILDGNVKRVLTRHLGDASDLAVAANARALHARALALLPANSADMPAYTQGLMDLGATVCTPRQPQCGRCPVAADCTARQQGRPESYPVKTRKLRRSAQTLWLLLAQTLPEAQSHLGGPARLARVRQPPGPARRAARQRQRGVAAATGARAHAQRPHLAHRPRSPARHGPPAHCRPMAARLA